MHKYRLRILLMIAILAGPILYQRLAVQGAPIGPTLVGVLVWVASVMLCGWALVLAWRAVAGIVRRAREVREQ